MLDQWLYVFIFEWIHPNWPYILTMLSTALSLYAAGHAIMRKRDIRSALGWAGLIMFSPGVGVILYFFFGINRVRRKALALRNLRNRIPAGFYRFTVEPHETAERFGEAGEVLAQIAKAVTMVSGRPLLRGNSIDVLLNGEEAYPAMLEAIEKAEKTITLETYIFDCDETGKVFVEALAAAHQRGVAVRVLIDAIGVRYKWPPAHALLRQRGVPVALFIPFRNIKVFNLRTHRKILVIDGKVGFTGGMNIRKHHLVNAPSKEPTMDIHFRIRGPVVNQLQEVFAEDWNFSTKEVLQGESWFAAGVPMGDIFARGIADGPDESANAMNWTLQAAIASARKRIRVVTPYFVPDLVLCTALGVAASRGIEVDIILPRKGNLRLVEWACWGQLSHVLAFGCRVWLTEPPFDHSKLMTVDGLWSLFGSTNWDQRSLRLNFEYNIEAQDRAFAEKLDAIIDLKIRRAQPLTLEHLRTRSFARTFRDALARLMTPYL